ncbi:MAG: pyridoxamine 5'-phosphate oxidase family protein [Patescibacteria group bacterium]
MPPTDKREEALSFLMSHTTGVLSTVSTEHKSRSRFVYYASDDTFSLYFITLANTRKVSDLANNSSASFVIAESDVPRTLQIEGDITDLTETATIEPTLVKLVDTLMSNATYGAPLTRFDSSTLRFYRLIPKWIRWGNFTQGHTTNEILSPIYPNPAT